jgi:uncharacterized membrane protein
MDKEAWALLSMFCSIFGIVLMVITVPLIFQEQTNRLMEHLALVGHQMGGSPIVCFIIASFCLILGVLAWFMSQYQIVKREK